MSDPRSQRSEGAPGESVEYLSDDEVGTLPVAEWLAVVAKDDPVSLPRPVVEYLAEARAAGEV